MKKVCAVFALLSTFIVSCAQTTDAQFDSLKVAVVNLKLDVDHVKLNLGRVEKRFKAGIFISTLGYSTVITGGLMLGRKNDQLGKALLIAGGATGITGTILMVDAFRFLGIASGKKTYRRQ